MKCVLGWLVGLVAVLGCVGAQESSGVERDQGPVFLDQTTSRRIPLLRNPFSSNDPDSADQESQVPSYTWVPPGLTFSCKEKAPGYYSDPQAKCQAYHLCMPDGRKYTMLCGIGTVFNQRTFVCDHWYNYPCASAESDYHLNNELWEHVLLPHSDGGRIRTPKSRAVSNHFYDDEDVYVDK